MKTSFFAAALLIIGVASATTVTSFSDSEASIVDLGWMNLHYSYELDLLYGSSFETYAGVVQPNVFYSSYGIYVTGNGMFSIKMNINELF